MAAPSFRLVTETRPGSAGLKEIHADSPKKADCCCLWWLPYYWLLGHSVFASYDGMHTIGGVVESAFNSLRDKKFSAAAKKYEKEGNK